jgi:hypothetical protein
VFLLCCKVLVFLATPGLDQGSTAAIEERLEMTCRPVPCFSADVKVQVGGRTAWGRLIHAGDGALYLEHLDPPAQEWAGAQLRAVLSSREPSPADALGWDSRAERDRARRQGTRVRVGSLDLPATIRVEGLPAAGTLTLTGHQVHRPGR